MKKEDLIYKDKEYQIYKKHAGATGSFQVTDCLDLIRIGIEGLKGWENGGFANKGDWYEILDFVIKKINELK